MLAYIIWNVAPDILHIGFITIRWYGILFACALGFGYVILMKIYKSEGKNEEDLDHLALYLIVGIVVGARLGHVIFYQPDYYYAHPLQILEIWHGGLASHGGAIGILIALYYYCKKYKQNMLWILDRLVIVTALGGSLIRIGNLFNSEILGIPSKLPWAFIFERVDNIPRHPVQLYESLSYFIIFLWLLHLYKRKKVTLVNGYLFGLFLTSIFSVRFLLEYVKVRQADFGNGFFLSMGQMLSIPFILFGIYFIIRSIKKAKHITAARQ